MLLVRECSQENRNFGFLSDDLLRTCLCKLFGAILGGPDPQWSPWWDSPGGIGITWDVTLEFSACTVHMAEVCLPVLSQEFCVASLCSSVFLSPKFEWWVGVFLILWVPAVVWDGS